MIILTKTMKSKSKKQFPTWSQNWLLLCNNSSILRKKWVMTVLLSQVDLSGSVRHLYQCFKCCDLSSFCSSFGNCLFYTCILRYGELQIHETASQVNKFSTFLCMEWCKNQGSLILFPSYVPQPSRVCNPAFSVSLGFTIGSGWSGCSLMTVRWCWLKNMITTWK